MITKSHEDTATYNNFFILPMAFFSGTFFPVDRIPQLLQTVVWVFPLTHTNALIRQNSMNSDGIAIAGGSSSSMRSLFSSSVPD